ncbi:CDP-alcohol phosphatidyltransferase family protein [Pilimelia columellifera]|uniref:CDP-alcohol phosphatidyltransferase family protein n=1 Tax=Pilimelia columellifera TaxID=706574 RepID=UPI0031DA9A26
MRRGGSIARQVLLVRVGRRGAQTSGVDPLVERLPRQGALSRIRPRRAASVPADAGRLIVAQPPAAAAPVPLLPGEQTLSRRVKFALVNVATLSSIGLGLTAILVAMHGQAQVAAALLVACVLFDGLDGALARRFGVSSPFGAQMDSLADMCSFGLATPVVVYASLAGTVPPAAAAVACALVAGSAAIRLARFNVSPQDGRFFSGVPTTMAAAVLAVVVLIGLPIPPLAQLGGVALLGFAMVSSFPYAKLARLATLPPWIWLAPLAAAFVDWRATFGLIVLGYLISGPMLWWRHRRAAAI